MPIATARVGEREISLETGTLAKQAHGSVVARIGDTIILATAVAGQPREGIDFFPLLVDYEEKMYAAGKIPGSRYVKREGRPTELAIVTGRRIDRPLRPLFPKGLRNDVQVIVTTLSADPENPPDIAAMIGASAALCLSPIPFDGPVAAVRVGRVEGRLILNPTFQELETSDLDMIVAGGRHGLLEVEAQANEMPEDEFIAALQFGTNALEPILAAQEDLARQAGKPKMEFAAKQVAPDLLEAAQEHATAVRDALQHPDKLARESAAQELTSSVIAALTERFPERDSAEISETADYLMKQQLRALILEQGRRPDGRAPDQLREITGYVGLIPRAHGSGLFTRGQTQVLSVVTLGSVGEEQLLDTLTAEESKRFMHHYNFPPYSVGEVRPLRGASRRDIGHGNLAERSLQPALPPEAEFPYTIRIVSEVLESNASSSMASVCASTLALMDAGVPIRTPVAGVSIGLITGEGQRILLTDIQGIEDFFGDMDCKIAGTRNGVTGMQMDIKLKGLDVGLLAEAIHQARRARMQILDAMQGVLSAPRSSLSPLAPRIFTIEIHPDKIGDVIGPGGKVIKKIQADFDVRIDIEQDGRVFIAAQDAEKGEQALKTIEDLTRELKIGETYVGKVVGITTFGAFVELLPGRDGMVHISELAHEHVEKVEDVVKIGDEVVVKVKDIDPTGKVRLTRKALLPGGPPAGEGDRPDRPSRPRREGGRGGGLRRDDEGRRRR